MINTLYLNNPGQYIDKKATLTIQAIVDGRGTKSVGTVSLNIARYHSEPISEKVFSLTRCKDKTAQICISVTGRALGEVGIADNMSEISGGSGFTEGDWVGPSVWGDQDLTGFEEEGSIRNPNDSRKPASFQRSMLNITGGRGAFNPNMINEVMQKQTQQLEDGKLPEMKAQISRLEKDNIQLNQEKEELKVELGVQFEKAKIDREKLTEHIKYLDEQLKRAKTHYDKVKSKVGKKDEQLAKYKEMRQNMLQDMKQLEKMVNDSNLERDRYKDECDTLHGKILQIQQDFSLLKRENEQLQYSLQQVNKQKEKLAKRNEEMIATIEQLRREISENQSSLSARDLENDQEFINFQRKADSYIEDLKLQLQESEALKEDVQGERDALLLENEKIRDEYSTYQDTTSNQIRRSEREIAQLKDEVAQLKARMKEEKEIRESDAKVYEGYKANYQNKLAKLQSVIEELRKQKEDQEQEILQYKEKLLEKNEVDAEVYNNLQGQIRYLEEMNNRYKHDYEEKNRQIEKLNAQKQGLNRQTMEQEVYSLRDQLRSVTSNTDSVDQVLRQRLNEFEVKLDQMTQDHYTEVAQLRERIDILEEELQLIETQKREMAQSYEERLSKLVVDNQLLQQQRSSLTSSPQRQKTSEVLSDVQSGDYQQTIKLLKIENEEFKQQVAKLTEQKKEIEKKFMEAKMSWTNADLEKDNCLQKLKSLQQEYRETTSQLTMMEVELYKVNEKFGQTLNMTNELEMELHRTRQEQQMEMQKVREQYENPPKKKKLGGLFSRQKQ